jgi:hypothetical protein
MFIIPPLLGGIVIVTSPFELVLLALPSSSCLYIVTVASETGAPVEFVTWLQIEPLSEDNSYSSCRGWILRMSLKQGYQNSGPEMGRRRKQS